MVTTMQDRLQERFERKRTTTSDYIIRLTDRLLRLGAKISDCFSHKQDFQVAMAENPTNPSKWPKCAPFPCENANLPHCTCFTRLLSLSLLSLLSLTPLTLRLSLSLSLRLSLSPLCPLSLSLSLRVCVCKNQTLY